jgi:hypothetical protein
VAVKPRGVMIAAERNGGIRGSGPRPNLRGARRFAPRVTRSLELASPAREFQRRH